MAPSASQSMSGMMSAPAPNGLNPRLEQVRAILGESLKVLFTMRDRLGVPEPPDAPKEDLQGSGAAGMAMDLMAISGRLKRLLTETLEQIG